MWAVITAKGQALGLAGWSLAAQPSAAFQQTDHMQQPGQVADTDAAYLCLLNGNGSPLAAPFLCLDCIFVYIEC